MSPFDNDTPVVLTFSSHDPTGGSGIQADIEALASIGCHCTPIITCVTAQDTCDIKDIYVMDAPIVIEQARAILEDLPVRAIKLGMLGSQDIIEAVHTILTDYPNIPVIFDPITAMGQKNEIDVHHLVAAMHTLLLPLTTLTTPNTVEAHELAPEADTINACAQEILETGCEYVMITGTHAKTSKVVNNLYTMHRNVKRYEWPRLPNIYHGAGATMASCCAGYLAHGLSIHEAIEQSQTFTWNSLNDGRRLGMGRHLPNRMHWTRSTNKSTNHGN